MDPRQRIVVQIPLTELWDDNGPAPAVRGASLSDAQIGERLRTGCAAVLASPGERLEWLRGNELFAWWKSEGKPHLLDPSIGRWPLDDVPEDHGWLATEWTQPYGTVLIGFEEFH